jgi:hypothetical protein
VPPPVVDAVKVTLAPSHMVEPVLELIVIVGVTIGFTVIVIPVLITVAGYGQLTLLVSWQVITSPLLRELVVNEVPPPTVVLFLLHIYEGLAPPFTVDATLNVTEVPAQIVVALALIVTAGTLAFTVSVAG